MAQTPVLTLVECLRPDHQAFVDVLSHVDAKKALKEMDLSNASGKQHRKANRF